MTNANGTAIAGGVIVASLIDMLVTKGVLSREDVGVLMGNAVARLVPLGQGADIGPARDAITLIAQAYAQRGG